MAKKLIPDLTYVKGPFDIPTEATPSENGFFFYWDGDVLKKSSMANIYEVIGGTNGSVTTAMTLIELNALKDGIYQAQTAGTYANGLIAREGYLTRFRKAGTVWTLAMEVELSLGYDPYEDQTLPSATWMTDNTFNAPTDLDNVILDRRNIVQKGAELISVSVFAKNNGNVEVSRYSLEYELIDTETKAVVTGPNELYFSGFYQEDYYVTVKGLTAAVGIVFPLDGPNVDSGYIVNGSFMGMGYKFGYGITSRINTIDQKFSTIGILQKSDFTNLKNAIASKGKVFLESKSFEIPETLIIPSGTTIGGVFGRTIFKAAAGFVGDILKSENQTDLRINNIVFEGNKADYAYSMNGVDAGANIINSLAEAVAGNYRTLENGIVLNSTERVILDGLIFRKLGGIGIKANHVGQSYINGLKASKIFIKDCHTGIFGENEHEFSSYSEMMVTLCQIGQIFSSGNLKVSNSIFTRSRIGLTVDKGYNHAHGSITDSFFKHHQIAGIATNEVELGHEITGCHFDYAKLLLNASKGIYFDGRMGFNCSVESIGNPGGSNIVNARTMSGIGDLTAGSNTTLTQVLLS